MTMTAPENKPQNQGIEMFEDYSMQSGFMATAPEVSDERFYFHNAANCPDCDGGMVKQGGCFSCPSCGFSACA
jgi:hypothetical protein